METEVNWCLALRGLQALAEMPTIMTSDVREDFQYFLMSYFVNISSF